jgi:3-dehydroquinate synthase
MREVTVSLGERSYRVCIGSGLLSRPDLLAGFIDAPQILVVTNTVVGPLYLDRLVRGLPGRAVQTLVLPDGESFKNLEQFDSIIEHLLQSRFSRDCLLVALGGGVVGDITGFAAACYQRGVRYVQVPTTLLAQVDSAVGGKTAVNHRLGKNMIGAFHQPAAVLADIDTLGTLPSRELAAGLAEVIKYGLIRDPGFFAWLEKEMDALVCLDPGALEYAIERCCRNKAEVVAADEREGGLRAILNLGHTFAHAMETAMDYRDLLHGEAVAIGMLMAADLSRRIGDLDASVPERLRNLLVRAKLPVQAPPGLSSEVLRDLMAVDKKSRGGRLRLVLLGAVGSAVVSDRFEESDLLASIVAYLPPGRKP